MPKQNSVVTIAMARDHLGSIFYRQVRLVMALALMLCMGFAGTATATSSSDHYMVNETQFGNGASLENCSENYCAQTSVGDTTVGDSASDGYGALSGSNTTDQPLFEVSTTNADEDLGVLSVDSTAALTMAVGVRTYLSNGYVMQIIGSPPSQGTHALTAMDTASRGCPCTSHPGMEQFGINLVANNTPGIGSDPVQVPSGQADFGTITADYTVPDLFKYEDGDVVAQSSINNGQTNYTISMILNISNTTPSGLYKGTFSAVVIPVY